MRIFLYCSVGFFIFLIGCQSNETMDQTDRHNVENTRFSQEEMDDEPPVKDDSYKQYTQSLEKGVGKDGYKEQIFTSDEEREIEQYITQIENVVSVYADYRDDQVNIIVSVRKGPYDEVKNRVKAYVKEHFPQRDIEVFIIQGT